MRKQSWAAYWNSTEDSFVERYIQRYKGKRGYAKLIQLITEKIMPI